jgi:hypothetical protein
MTIRKNAKGVVVVPFKGTTLSVKGTTVVPFK